MADAIEQAAYTHTATSTPEEQRKAAVTVAARATSPTDCRELLDMLGLTGTSTRLVDVEHGLRGYRKGCKCPTCTAANRNRNRERRGTQAGAPINARTGDTG